MTSPWVFFQLVELQVIWEAMKLILGFVTAIVFNAIPPNDIWYCFTSCDYNVHPIVFQSVFLPGLWRHVIVVQPPVCLPPRLVTIGYHQHTAEPAPEPEPLAVFRPLVTRGLPWGTRSRDWEEVFWAVHGYAGEASLGEWTSGIPKGGESERKNHIRYMPGAAPIEIDHHNGLKVLWSPAMLSAL